ncbi:MAG: type II toxin-antitoxin system VapC family toxin [Tessaracoccus sp.]|uniref:type II toxin-antitoxin system VapC family toxin n=1 Tax=Tessaracoccus sp. TaxID=1971211 RepID=UPI001EC22A72|nr:type II toxin-antitoxin system VapC family toxin [Tessaracoccus sp.]MBK7821741.1 type II toxin-antitoxin system VapC family toxin [Tessaracoccus sp.]
MSRVFIDANVPIFALGGESPHRVACLNLLERAARGEVVLHASVEMVQEVLFHRLRRGDAADAVAQSRLVAASCVLHPFDGEVLQAAIELVERSGMRGRDAVHAATALEQGFDEIVTVDSDFDRCPGLARVDPGSVAVR